MDVKFHSRPEWQLGFSGMRRIEIVQYARQYRHKIGWKDEFETLPKDTLVKMMDGYMAQGHIPHPYQAIEHPAVIEARQATEKVAALTKQVEELLARANASSDQPKNQKSDLIPELKSPEQSPEQLSWPQLKKYAKSKGLETHGKKRPEILEALGR